MKTRTDIINHLIGINGYKKYLEIGVRTLEENFNHINAEYKIGVDPDPKSKTTFIETSDEFFRKNKEQFDIVFVDGLHEAKQVYRDIDNALEILTEGGTVVAHDCLPETEIMQSLPQRVSAWTGDAWKAFVRYREKHPNLKTRVVDIDYGVGIITKSEEIHPFEAGADLTYENFEKNKTEWLNVISVDEFWNEKKPVQIFYTIPWNGDKNIGKYYNDFMNLLPNDDCFMCALDGDAMFLDKFFGKHLEQIIDTHRECGCFTAMTNRIGCKWQRQPDIDWENNDIAFHREKAQEVWETSGTDIRDVSDVGRGKVLGGVVILLKKSVWKKIGGFKKDGILGIDNDLHWKCMDNNEPVYLMKGIYVYHWYRGGDISQRGHLL